MPPGTTRPQPASSASSCSDAFVSGSGLSTGPNILSLPPQLSEAVNLERLFLRGNPLPASYRNSITSDSTETARRVLAFLRGQEVPRSLPLGNDDDEPDPPELGPASTFVPTPQGFELEVHGPDEHEVTDLSQKALHARLRRRVDRLHSSMGRISNTHPGLAWISQTRARQGGEPGGYRHFSGAYNRVGRLPDEFRGTRE